MKENYIKIEDTAFPRSVIMNKMVLSAAADHYTREEINALMEKLSLIDADDGATASVGESLMETAEGATARVRYGEEAAM